MYCHIFPNMDTDRALDARAQPTAWDISNEILFDMGNRFAMAGQWTNYLARLHRHFRNERLNWRILNGSPASATSENNGVRTHYESWGFETEHLEHGSWEDKELETRNQPGRLEAHS